MRHLMAISLPVLCWLLISSSFAVGVVIELADASQHWLLEGQNVTSILLSVSCLTLFLIYRWCYDSTGRAQSMAAPQGLTAAYALLAAVSALILQGVIDQESGVAFVSSATQTQLSLPLVLALTTVVPISEELAFRGWLVDRVQTSHGSTTAALASSTLFSLLHLPTSSHDAVVYFLVGLVLAILFVRTRRLWACVLVHAILNVHGITGR